MAKTKISEFSSTPGNNTDIDGINIAEGCAPSGINNAIRELMSQLKDFQAGTAGDSFNGPVGTTTAAAGAFTTLSASSTVSGTGFSNYLASPPAIGGTTAAAGSFTTLTTSGAVTHNAGTANGVAYLNGSKVLTTGSALTFDGSQFDIPAGTAAAPSLSTPADVNTGLYFPAADTIGLSTNGTERMRLDSSGNLGIGTSSPNNNSGYGGVTINGTTGGILDIKANGTDVMRIFGTATQSMVRTVTATPLLFGTSDLERMRLDSSGNLGLGVTPSAARFESYTAVSGASGWSIAGQFTSTNYPMIRLAAITPNKYSSIGNNADGGFMFFINGTLNAVGTQAMTLDASGRLGIGTTSPQASLTVGSVAAGTGESTNRGLIQIQSNGGGSATGGGGLEFKSASSGGGYGWMVASPDLGAGSVPLVFSHRNESASWTERARIDSSGNLLLGTTSVLNNSVATFFKTATGANQRVATFVNNGTSGSTTAAGIIISYPNAANGNGSTFIQCMDGNTDRFYVLGSGNVQNTNNSYGAISDAKLKENVTDATPKLDKLNQVRVVNYNLIGEEQKQIGVIAQELEQVFPGMVEETKDRDKDGNDLGTTTKSVKYSVFVPMLIKAIQEQQAIITALTARVAALESN